MTYGIYIDPGAFDFALDKIGGGYLGVGIIQDLAYLMGERDSHRREELDSIIDALMDENIDPIIKSKIQSWFVSDFADDHGKQEAFTRYANKLRPYLKKLSGDFLSRYNELAVILGLQPVPVRKCRRGSCRWAAAILLPAAAFAVCWLMIPRTIKSPVGLEMRIAKSDRIQSALLPDSSLVSVGLNSTILYYETEGESRKVDLSGEAMFMVRRDETRSFTVSTTSMTVNVLGTDFVVSEFPGSSYGTVELYSGKVDVETQGSHTILSRGEMLFYDLSTRQIDVSIIPASRMIEKGYKPRLKFDNATFGEVIVALAAFHDIEIEIASGIDANTGSISGDIENNMLGNALDTIFKMWKLNVAHKREGDKIIIYRK